MSKEALSGLRVVEYADLISGPYCAKMMADLGAEVIKVERPDVGDQARHWEPFQDDHPDRERSGLFLFLNTSKKGITLDVTTPTGMQCFRKLIERCDVFIENNPPRVMEELGLTYAELSKINPKLVMVSITPFGQDGPYRDYKANELVTFHMSGLGYETPRATDPKLTHLPPLKGGGYFAKFFAAVNAAGAAMAAVHAARRDGVGQHVDISEQQCLAPLLRRPLAIYAYDDKKIVTRFMHTWKVAPHHFMKCKDGDIFASVVEEHQWTNLVEVMGNPEWAQDPRFLDGPGRLENWALLEPHLSKWLLERTKDQVWRETQAKGIPFAPVTTVEDLRQSPQLQAREFFIAVEHPEMGQTVLPGAPYKFSETPFRVTKAAPLLGEHNEEVLCGLLGYTKMDLVKMGETGIV